MWLLKFSEDNFSVLGWRWMRGIFGSPAGIRTHASRVVPTSTQWATVPMNLWLIHLLGAQGRHKVNSGSDFRSRCQDHIVAFNGRSWIKKHYHYLIWTQITLNTIYFIPYTFIVHTPSHHFMHFILLHATAQTSTFQLGRSLWRYELHFVLCCSLPISSPNFVIPAAMIWCHSTE